MFGKYFVMSVPYDTGAVFVGMDRTIYLKYSGMDLCCRVLIVSANFCIYMCIPVS